MGDREVWWLNLKLQAVTPTKPMKKRTKIEGYSNLRRVA